MKVRRAVFVLCIVAMTSTIPGQAGASVSKPLPAGTWELAGAPENGSAGKAGTKEWTIGSVRAEVAASMAAGASPSFQAFQAIPVGSRPESVAIGDVTGDGRRDVVMSTSFYFDEDNDFKLFVFPQLSSGALGAPIKYDTHGTSNSSPMGLAIGDLDGDSKQDVALATDAGVDVFFQNGGLDQATLVPTDSPVRHVEVRDLDGDNDHDIVASGEGITILESSAGSFTTDTLPTDFLKEIEVEDLSGDGRPDIVALGSTVETFIQYADGTFSPGASATTGGQGLAVGDVNDDGRADVVLSDGGNKPNSKVKVLLQTTSGGLGDPVIYNVYDIPEPIEIADVNKDGLADVVTAHGGWNEVGVLTQTDSGTLAPEKLFGVPYASHYNLKGLAVGDVNGDAKPDIVLADYNNGLVVLRQGASSGGGDGDGGGGGGGPVTPKATSLSLTLSTSKVTYGKRVVARAKLDAPDRDQKIEFYAKPVGGTKQLLMSVRADGSGRAAISFRPALKMEVFAEFKGTETLRPSRSADRTLNVRARTIAKLFRNYGKSGRYHLFHAGVYPVQACAVSPNHAGSTVRFVAQYLDGSWRKGATAEFQLGSNGIAGGKLRVRQAGLTIRVKCTFGGDKHHLGSSSPWRYLKITL